MPASRDYSKYVTNSLSLNAALSASGASDSRREKTQKAFFFSFTVQNNKKQNMMSVHDRVEELLPASDVHSQDI